MDESTHQQLVFEANRKSVSAAYLLWFFIGFLGAHRFYAGRKGSGFAQLALLLIPFLGWAILAGWWIADLFLIPGIIREENMKTIEEIAGPRRPAERLDKPQSPADRKRAEMLEDLRQTGYSRQGFGSRRPDY